MRATQKEGKRLLGLLSLALCFGLIIGCGKKQETLVYVGQSDNWKAILTTVHAEGGTEEQQVLRLSYKSADIDSVYNVQYRLMGLPVEVSGHEDDMNNKSSIVHRTDCVGCTVTDEASTFTVAVDWSPNRKESFPLKFIREE